VLLRGGAVDVAAVDMPTSTSGHSGVPARKVGLVAAAAPAAQQVQRPAQRFEDAAAANVVPSVVAALATIKSLPGLPVLGLT
jgi:hypothetical protein